MQLRNYLFHRISNEKDDHWPPMEPKLFENIIQYLTRKHKVVLLEDVLADTAAFSRFSDKFVTISFDDGYKDNIEIAAPILKKYYCPASFYIVTNCIDSNTPTWTYLVDFIVSNTHREKIVLPFENIPECFREIKLSAGIKNGNAVRKIKPWLKSLSNRQRITVVNALIDQCNDLLLPTGQMMNWNDIKQLKTEGHYIGSHSHTHPMLATLESEDEIQNELTVSGRRIKEETGSFPLTISYPVGSFDDRVIRLAQANGYRWGVAVGQRFFNYDSQSLYSISRVELYNEPMWKARLRIAGIISGFRKIMKS